MASEKWLNAETTITRKELALIVKAAIAHYEEKCLKETKSHLTALATRRFLEDFCVLVCSAIFSGVPDDDEEDVISTEEVTDK